MSDTQETGTMSREESLQYAFDAAVNVEKVVMATMRRDGIRQFLYVAGAFGSAFLVGGLVPLALINGAFILGAIEKRESNLRLAQAFNYVASHMDDDAKFHLRDVSNEIGKIDYLNFAQVKNMVKDKQKLPAMLFVGITALILPLFTPAAIAQIFQIDDSQRAMRIWIESKKAQNEMKRLFPHIVDERDQNTPQGPNPA